MQSQRKRAKAKNIECRIQTFPDKTEKKGEKKKKRRGKERNRMDLLNTLFPPPIFFQPLPRRKRGKRSSCRAISALGCLSPFSGLGFFLFLFFFILQKAKNKKKKKKKRGREREERERGRKGEENSGSPDASRWCHASATDQRSILLSSSSSSLSLIYVNTAPDRKRKVVPGHGSRVTLVQALLVTCL